MSLPVLATLALFVALTQAQTANPVVTPVTDTYIPHASYPYSDIFGTGPISAYRETQELSYDDPPSTSLVSIVKKKNRNGLLVKNQNFFAENFRDFAEVLSQNWTFSYRRCCVYPAWYDLQLRSVFNYTNLHI